MEPNTTRYNISQLDPTTDTNANCILFQCFHIYKGYKAGLKIPPHIWSRGRAQCQIWRGLCQILLDRVRLTLEEVWPPYHNA